MSHSPRGDLHTDIRAAPGTPGAAHYSFVRFSSVVLS